MTLYEMREKKKVSFALFNCAVFNYFYMTVTWEFLISDYRYISHILVGFLEV